MNISRAADWHLVMAQIEERMKYILQGFGDLADPHYNGGYKAGLHEPLEFPTLMHALWFLEKWAVEIEETEDIAGDKSVERLIKIDPEDDRVLIWEVLDSGHKRVVWHFSGWHWDHDEFGLEQGHFIGHKDSVYSECMDNY